MKKFILALLFMINSLVLFSQTHKMIADSAYFVMEVDLGKIIKSVPLLEINQLDFVKSLLKDLESDTAQINGLSVLGVDFNSKLFYFTIEREFYSSESIIFPIKDKKKFIQAFHPHQQATLLKNGSMERDGKLITMSASTCIMSTINWKSNFFRKEARKVFKKNNWELPNNYYYFSPYDNSETIDEEIEVSAPSPDSVNRDDEVEIDGEFHQEDVITPEELAQIKLEEKFAKVLDSIKTIRKSMVIQYHQGFIKTPSTNLYTSDDVFRTMSQTRADAKVYFNPIINYAIKDEYKYHPLQKFINVELNETRQFAYLNFTTDGLQMDWKMHTSENVAQLMKAAKSRKIDRKLLKYIPENAQGVGVYNINTFGAYNKLKAIYMPQLDSSTNENELFVSAVWSTIDEFIDMEAITSVYPPKMLFTYAGLKNINLTKTTYAYDEKTFEYTEIDTNYKEKIPMVTMVLANEKAYLLEKYMKAFSKSKGFYVVEKDQYYTFKNSTTMEVPFHLAVIDDIVLLTNDENTVKNHLKGFSSKGFDRKVRRKIKRTKLFYAHFNFEELSRDIAELGLLKNTDKYTKLFSNKTGKMNIELSSISKNQAHYVLNFETKKEYKNGGYFLFQLMNAIYLYNKKQ